MENQSWFIFEEGHHRGPFSLDQMKKFLKLGTVRERTKVWRHGHAHWRNLSQFEEFKQILPTLPLTEIANPPPIVEAMFADLDKFPTLDEIVATQLHPEQKVELKRELKAELKNEIRGEMTPEFEPRIKAGIESGQNKLREQIQKEMLPRIKAEVIDHRISLKNELKKEIQGEIGPEMMRPHIKTEMFEQRDGIKHELKEELSPRIRAEILDQRTRITEELDSKLKNKMGPEHFKAMSGKISRDLQKTLKEEFKTNISFERPKFEEPAQLGKAKKEPASKVKKALSTVMVGIPLAMAMIYFFIYLPSIEFDRPLDMPDKSFTEFKKVTKTDLFLGLKTIAAFSFTGEKIFFSSNMGGQGHYQIKVVSVPGKILSTSPIRAVSKGYYQNKLVTFDRFTMQEGKKFVPGDYQVSITAEQFEWSKTFWDIFIDEPIKAPILNTVITWKGKNPEKFDELLGKFLEQIGDQRGVILEEIKQKYLTQIGLLNQIQDKIKTAFGKRNPGKVFKSFYLKQIGPILSSISLKSREAMTRVNISDPFLYSQYKKQLNIGKQIGLLATDGIEKLKPRDYKFKNQLLKRIATLKEEIFLETYKKADHTGEL